MAELDNPAGRLLHLLRLLRRKASRGGSMPLGHALSDVLGADREDGAETLRRLAAMMDLPAQIRGDVARLPFDASSHVRKLRVIERALLKIDVETSAKVWVAQLDPTAMHELELCSSLLSQHLSNGIADQSSLDKLRDRIHDVIDECKESINVPAEIRVILLAHLHEMLRAIDLYPVVGLDALESAVERGIGALVIRPELRDVESSLLSKFRRVLADAANVVTIATGVVVLGNQFFPEVLPVNEVHTVQIERPRDTEDTVDGEKVVLRELEAPTD